MAKPRISMITPVWGAAYIERWLDLCFATQRAEGNIPYLNRNADFSLVIATKAADIEYMRTSERFGAMTAGLHVDYVTIDEFFPPHGTIPYGIPLTLAYAKAIQSLGENAPGSFVMIMNADCMLADGSFKGILDRIQAGYDIICSTSVRTVDGRTRDDLLARVDPVSGVLAVPPRQMMRMALDNLHSTVSGRIVNDVADIDSTYYHQIFWRVSDDCLAMRGFMVHPLCFRIERMMDKVICPVDYGFMIEMAPTGKFCVIGDSDDYVMMELQARDSESHWLRFAPAGQTLDQRLEQLSGEILDHASTWTTSEHRRYAHETILYHSGDLPSDLEERLAPFHSFIDGILNQLPAPVSHIGHFQWLPAVRIYREDMERGGAPAFPALLDDPRNQTSPSSTAQAQTAPIADSPDEALCDLPLPLRLPLRIYRSLSYRSCKLIRNLRIAILPCAINPEKALHEACRRTIADMIETDLSSAGPAGLDVVYVEDAAKDAPRRAKGTRITRVEDPSHGRSRKDFNIVAPTRSTVTAGPVVVYARPGLLPVWENIGDDVATMLTSGGYSQVRIAFIQERYGRLGVTDHAFMLSILLSSLFRPGWRTRVEVMTQPQAGMAPQPATDSPEAFSALLLSITPR